MNRLAELFQASGCDRTDIKNHAIVIVDQRSLNKALSHSDLTADMIAAHDGASFPMLNFPSGIRIQCLHGVDRLAAARKVLPSGDQRWIVDLYSAGIVLQEAKLI